MGGGYWVKKVEESQIWAASGKGVESGGGVSMGENESVALPLTFMDIPWLLFPPTQPLFFFQIDDEEEDEDVFSRNVVPKLKESLAWALHHFYPLASTLLLLLSSKQHENEAHLQLSFPCSIPLTVAVAHHHHHHLFSNHPIDAAFFHLLVPHLPTLPLPPPPHTHSSHPLFSIQITHFPSSSNSIPPAFSLGFASHPLLSDQRTFHHFLTTWSSFSKLAHPPPPPPPLPLPSFDRSPIIDPTTTDLHSTLLNHCLSSHSLPLPMSPTTLLPMDMLRATFVITPTHIHHTRLWIQARCDHSHTPHPPLLSPYVVTCAIVWACFAQLHYHSNPKPHASSSSPMYMGFIAGGITRLPYPVPSNYFGNCVAFGRAVAERKDLLLLPRHLNQNEHNEENKNENGGKVYENQGILAAAHAISKAIKDLDDDVLGQAHRWILDWEPIIGTDEHISMVGSPKVELYEIDFGWGTPKKIEEISIDGMRGRGVSLMQSREVKGGIEIGVTLPSSAMHTFSFLFNHTLAFMSSPT